MLHLDWKPHKDMQEAFYGSLRLLIIKKEGKTYYELSIGKFKRHMTNYDKFVKEVKRLV
jgi:hypothetical protein